MLRPASLLVLATILFGGAWSLTAEQTPPGDARKAAQKAQADGNFKDAFAMFEKLALDPANTTVDAADDIHRAVQCLSQCPRARTGAIALPHRFCWRAKRCALAWP